MAQPVEQKDLIEALRDPACYPHPVEHVAVHETHISVVLLAGEYAYKLKKPVDLGFLDFSSLDKRRFYCEEELRVNGRFAAALYLDVVPITCENGSIRLEGAGAPVEYAVRMRRFPQEALLGHLAESGGLTESLVRQLAETVAEFHTSVPAAASDDDYGSVEEIRQRALENFPPLRDMDLDAQSAARLDALERWTREYASRLAPVFDARRDGGWVRECHGDLHLDNMLLWQGRVTLFDAIEFAPDLRWIDTANDLAFTLMDLRYRGETAAANAVLSRYLETTGDYEALRVLPFYIAYRAMVRAKVEAVRCAQARDGAVAASARERLRRYLDVAAACMERPPGLVGITHGLSGSGKSTLAQALVERYGYIRLRSDVERKRLFGLDERECSGSGLATGIYSAEASRRTYERLATLARSVVEAGYQPVVDAAFLRTTERAPFRELAQTLGAEFRIFVTDVDQGTLRERLRRRATAGTDASEADEQVLARQLEIVEPLTPAERTFAISDTAALASTSPIGTETGA